MDKEYVLLMWEFSHMIGQKYKHFWRSVDPPNLIRLKWKYYLDFFNYDVE